MTDFRAVNNSANKIFESALNKVSDQLDIKRKDSSVGIKLLNQFDEVKKYNSVYVHNVTELKGESNSFIAVLVEKHLTIIVPKKRRVAIKEEVEEVEPMVLFSVPVNMGRVIIRPETIADKIADLLYKVDIDFKEFPIFSKNYYVIAEKPELVKTHLPKKLIESLNIIKNMTIEINGNWGLIRPDKNLTEDLLLLLMSIGYKMTT